MKNALLTLFLVISISGFSQFNNSHQFNYQNTNGVTYSYYQDSLGIPYTIEQWYYDDSYRLIIDTVNFSACDTVIMPTGVVNYLKGQTGATGPQGVQGIQGIQGIQGAAGNDATSPAGGIQLYAGSSAPTGYLICDGSAVSRTTYSVLFAVIGTTYGSGDGSTTFNLPDLKQRFPLGKAASGTGNTLGATGGAIDHVHSVDPPNTTTTASSNINNVTLLALGSASAPSHTHDVNISSFNSDSANPPFLVVNYIIKY